MEMVIMGALTSKIYSFEARPWELKKEKGLNLSKEIVKPFKEIGGKNILK